MLKILHDARPFSLTSKIQVDKEVFLSSGVRFDTANNNTYSFYRLGDGWVAPLQSYLPTSKLLDAQRVIDASAVSTGTGRSPNSIRRGRNISGIIDDEGKYGNSLQGQGEAVVGR